MKITNLPQDPGPAAWNAILPEQQPFAHLEDTQTADWLIIGAGFAGLSAAQRLLELHPKDKIIILDATRVAYGPAGRNSGFMIDLPHDLASDQYTGAIEANIEETKANRHGIEFAADMAKLYGLSEQAFSLCGKINAAASAKGIAHNSDYSEHLNHLGEKHEILDAQNMRQITGIPFYKSGLYTPGAAIIQPAQYIRSIANGLIKQGIKIFENSPVIELMQKQHWIATTPKGRITAPKVILAVNGHLNSFGFQKQRLMHVFTYASMSAVLSAEQIKKLGGKPEWSLTPADPMGSTVRRISGVGGDRLVIRNRFTFDPSMKVSDQRIAKMGMSHDKSFAARFPMLKDVSMEYRWSGRLCLSRNNVTTVGELDENLYSACCQNGLGTAKGTFGGKIIAELASGLSSKMSDYATSHAPPQKLPPSPIAKIGANCVIKWQEMKAGIEL